MEHVPGTCRHPPRPSRANKPTGDHRRFDRTYFQEVRMGRFRRAIVAASVVFLILGIGIGPSFASSHREAPLTAADPQIDSTDLYAFVSPDAPDTVTLISNWIPFESPAGGPNFYPWAENTKYDINIDNNADAKPDITYRWTFTTHYKSK